MPEVAANEVTVNPLPAVDNDPPLVPNIESQDILDALMALHVKYTAWQVEMHAQWEPPKPDESPEKENWRLIFHAVLQGTDIGFKCANDITPFGAVKKLIKAVGDLDLNTERQKKIAKLRSELQKLEAEGRQGEVAGPQAAA